MLKLVVPLVGRLSSLILYLGCGWNDLFYVKAFSWCKSIFLEQWKILFENIYVKDLQ